MFTVLHHMADGTEAIYAAKGVRYVPSGIESGLHIETVDGAEFAFAVAQEVMPGTQQARAYVMNDAGKTVATYYL